MQRREWIVNYVKTQIDLVDTLGQDVELIIDKINDARKNKRRIFIAGNGGSLSNASHFAQDLSKGASDALQIVNPNNLRFNCIALDNISWITATSNDAHYAYIFINQLKSLANPLDVFIGLSVSGTSQNMVEAMKWSQTNKLNTIALLGNRRDYPAISTYADTSIIINDSHFGRVEDAMMSILHMVCYYFIENAKEI